VPDLKPALALGGETPARRAIGALTLVENSDLGLASLALRRSSMVPTPLGLTLPGPGGWVGEGAVSAFWTGPGQWMVEGGNAAEGDFAATIAAAAPGCSVTDQTDGWVAFEVLSSDGPAPILRLLERLANLDAEAFTPGHALRTTIDHMGVFVVRRAADHLAILGMRGFAGSLWHALATAATRL
jgi:sarcosine oxidase subunit gamma